MKANAQKPQWIEEPEPKEYPVHLADGANADDTFIF